MKKKNLKLRPLTEPLTGIDIGKPDLPGAVKQVAGGYDISAGGKDIWEKNDQGYFAYQLRTGDFDFVVRVKAMEAADLYSKAGVMARSGLTDDSAFIYFQVFSNNNPRNHNLGGYEFQYRLNQGANCKAIYPPSEHPDQFPVNFPDTWIRLKRKDSQFTGLYSQDGLRWDVYADFSAGFPTTVYLGLAVTSHNEAKKISTEFRDIGEYRE
jgi:Uncharacterized conserved protein